MRSGTRASLPAVGEGGGVCSIAIESEPEMLSCDRFRRLLGCWSGDWEPEAGIEGVDEADEEDGRLVVVFVESAARAAWVMGIWMPRLGSESDLRRVL